MAKTIQLRAKTYSDAVYVEGVANYDRTMAFDLERHCRTYFNEHYKGVFFCSEDKRMEIFQDAFNKLREDIENGKLHVEDGVLFGPNNVPFTGTLQIYFMSILRKVLDVVYVEGVANHDRRMAFDLESHCRTYFNDHYMGVFFCGEDKRNRIFQDAFIKLWENIENGKLHVEDGVLLGANDKPFTSTLTTYLMSIARLKYLEYTRTNRHEGEINDEEKKGHIHKGEGGAYGVMNLLYDKSTIIMEDIIADCIAVMSERCNQILTKFYYEKKGLDVIMSEIPSFSNKNALKTMKYKCTETLRANAQAMYKRYLNS